MASLFKSFLLQKEEKHRLLSPESLPLLLHTGQHCGNNSYCVQPTCLGREEMGGERSPSLSEGEMDGGVKRACMGQRDLSKLGLFTASLTAFSVLLPLWAAIAKLMLNSWELIKS